MENNGQVKKAVERQEKGLRSIAKEVCIGVKDGIAAGIKNGLREGVKQGLQDCLKGETAAREPSELVAECKQIVQVQLKEAVKKGAKNLFDKPAVQIEDGVCAELVKGLPKAELTKMLDLAKNPIAAGALDALREQALDSALKMEREVFKDMVTSRVPDNPLFMPIIEGLDLAFQDSLTENFEAFPEHFEAAAKIRIGG